MTFLDLLPSLELYALVARMLYTCYSAATQTIIKVNQINGAGAGAAKIAPNLIVHCTPIVSLSATLPWSRRGDKQEPATRTLHIMDRGSFCVLLFLVCLAAAPVARSAAVSRLAVNASEFNNATHHVGHAGVPWESCDYEASHYPYIWLVLYIYLTLVLFLGEVARMRCVVVYRPRGTPSAPQAARIQHDVRKTAVFMCLAQSQLLVGILSVARCRMCS